MSLLLTAVACMGGWMCTSVCAAGPPAADEFILDDGIVLKGEVLKETDTHIFVDVGFTVLDVPRERIVERVTTGAAPEDDGDSTRSRHLYSTSQGLARLSLEEAIDRYGESVVVVKRPGALGSGFVVREDGYIITNAHVVQGEVEVTITVHRETDDGVEKRVFEEVEIVAVNPHIDLALLKIDADELADFPLKRVHFGNVDELEKGETVFAVGAPLGLERSVSEGIVSIKNRAQNGIVYVQTTAAVNPGNSGGPLFNQKGEVIGVNTWGYMFSEGLNFSIPINFVKFFIDNRDAFAFDKDNPNTGYRYLQPPGRAEETPTGN